MIKRAYSVSFLLSINIFEWQNVLYFLDAPRNSYSSFYTENQVFMHTGITYLSPEQYALSPRWSAL